MTSDDSIWIKDSNEGRLPRASVVRGLCTQRKSGTEWPANFWSAFLLRSIDDHSVSSALRVCEFAGRKLLWTQYDVGDADDAGCLTIHDC